MTSEATQTIRYAVGASSLGQILIAVSDDGICAILFGKDHNSMTHDLQSRFPGTALIDDARVFEQWGAGVAGLIDTPAGDGDLALDLRGTAFQRSVWQALRGIRPGDTASYGEIAERIGQPRASRAVARACADNPIAVAIPCHRVVRKNGALSGYRWGVARKQALLDREAAA